MSKSVFYAISLWWFHVTFKVTGLKSDMGNAIKTVILVSSSYQNHILPDRLNVNCSCTQRYSYDNSIGCLNIKMKKKSLFDIETLHFDIWFKFICLNFWCPKIHVTHECFRFFIERSALHMWSSNKCQMSISWHITQSLVYLVMASQPKCPNLFW